MHQILRLKAVLARIGVSKTTLYGRIAAGTFPKPFPLGDSHAVGWLESEVDAAIESWRMSARGAESDPIADGVEKKKRFLAASQ